MDTTNPTIIAQQIMARAERIGDVPKPRHGPARQRLSRKLGIAIKHGNVGAAEELLRRGCSVNDVIEFGGHERGSGGVLPLTMAIEHQDQEIVALLLANGASPTHPSPRGPYGVPLCRVATLNNLQAWTDNRPRPAPPDPCSHTVLVLVLTAAQRARAQEGLPAGVVDTLLPHTNDHRGLDAVAQWMAQLQAQAQRGVLADATAGGEHGDGAHQKSGRTHKM